MTYLKHITMDVQLTPAAVRWMRINRLKARIVNGDAIDDYAGFRDDIRIALHELDHHLEDATNLRVEKKLVWEQINRADWRRGALDIAAWGAVIVIWVVAGIIFWRVARGCS